MPVSGCPGSAGSVLPQPCLSLSLGLVAREKAPSRNAYHTLAFHIPWSWSGRGQMDTALTGGIGSTPCSLPKY